MILGVFWGRRCFKILEGFSCSLFYGPLMSFVAIEFGFVRNSLRAHCEVCWQSLADLRSIPMDSIKPSRKHRIAVTGQQQQQNRKHRTIKIPTKSNKNKNGPTQHRLPLQAHLSGISALDRRRTSNMVTCKRPWVDIIPMDPNSFWEASFWVFLGG